MYNLSKNQQVIYSLDLLSDSLFNLLKTENLNDITITEICNNTNINRRTYYRNCENILDLIIYKMDKMICEIINNTDWNSKDERKLYTNFFNYWYNQKFYLSIIKRQDLFSIFFNRFKIQLNNITYPFMEVILEGKNKFENIKSYYNSFIIGGLINILECWVENDFNIPINDLIDMLCSLAPLH